METKLLHRSNELNLSKDLGLRILIFIFFSLFISLQSFAQSTLLDINYQKMSFKNAQKLSGEDDNGFNGKAVGSVYRFDNVIVKDGITLYAKLTVLEDVNANIVSIDDDGSGDVDALQPKIKTKNKGGYVTYQIEYFNAANNASVYIYDYTLTGKNIDGQSSSNKKFIEVGGYNSCQLKKGTKLSKSDQPQKKTRFDGSQSPITGDNFDNTSSFTADYKHANNKCTIKVGQSDEKSDDSNYSIHCGDSDGDLGDHDDFENVLPVAADDNASINYFATGSAVNVLNSVLTNDTYNGSPVQLSAISINVITPASNSGVRLDPNTGIVSVAAGTPGGIYTIVYRISMKNSDSECDEDADVATVTVKVLQANLTITKTASPNTNVNPGQNVTYTITVKNNGPTDASLVVVSDQLPSDLTFVSANPNATLTGSTYSWSQSTLGNNLTSVYTLVGKVKSTFTGSKITNSASVTSSTPDPDATNNSSSVDVSIKLVPPTAVDDNVFTDYNTPNTFKVTDNDLPLIAPFTIAFTGNQPEASKGVFTITNSTTGEVKFTPALNYAGSASINYIVTDANGQTAQAKITCTILNSDLKITKTASQSDNVVPGQTVTFTLTVKNNGPNDARAVVLSDQLPAGLIFVSSTPAATVNGSNLTWNLATVANTQSQSVSFQTTVNANFTGTQITNTASVAGSTFDPNTNDNSDNVVLKIKLADPVAVDDNYTTLINTEKTFNVTGNDLNVISPYTITFDGNQPGASKGVFSIINSATGDVKFVPANNYVGTASIDYKITDANGKYSKATITITIANGSANLGITKTAVLNTNNGNQITYTITVTNAGPNAAQSVVVTDDIPSTLTVSSATPSIGTWSAPNKWNIESLASGATPATLTIVAKADATYTGDIVNNVSVASSTPDPDQTNNTASVTKSVTGLTGPTAVDDGTSTSLNTPVNINVLQNDTYVSSPIDVTSVTFVAGTEPATSTGLFTVNHESGLVTFNPASGFTGTATIGYKIKDGNGLSSNQALITVTVTASIVNNFPATGFATLAFEDLWPALGDYDMNDLVLDYKFQTTSNANNFVDKVVGTFVIKAFGASLENGFGFQLPGIANAEDLTVTGYSLKENFINLNSKGTETGQAKPTIIVYDNAFKQMTSPGGIGVNTDPTQPYVQPKTLTITITFKPNTYTINNLDIANFNPFLIVNKVRGVEVHLPNYAPTSLANQSLFGTADDRSNPTQNKYYRNANNLPWAINFVQQFDYPKEKVDIITVYNHFAAWALSGGSLFQDWYKPTSDNRNAGLIYTIPQ